MKNSSGISKWENDIKGILEVVFFTFRTDLMPHWSHWKKNATSANRLTVTHVAYTGG